MLPPPPVLSNWPTLADPRNASGGLGDSLAFKDKAVMVQRLATLLRSKGFPTEASRCEHAAAAYQLAANMEAQGDTKRALALERRLSVVRC